MSKDHESVVSNQFSPQARAYVESPVHARGEDLDALEALVRAKRPNHALDLGTGGGHVAYRLAAHAASVTACDLSADMLAAVAATAGERGLTNIRTVQAPVESLPFEAGCFDFLGCRYSAHHWRVLDAGLREARRVLAPGSTAVFIDSYAPAPGPLDTHIQAVELLRDVSHSRNPTLAEWLAALSRAGFTVDTCRTWKLRLDFASWTARMRTPEEHVGMIRALQRAASAEVRAHFAIEEDGSFQLDVMAVTATAA
ncbi:methyltransferase domain-containing protein [Azospirillum sp. RWY-5-1]|uniref:Methyltransferase domain-containing protein n=1 Tax=Azospirillum oleiclasticum TaxID=2735135 RepID=A0ABX2T4L1_9PROT|nr:class I SAM-dependent methyltransferase [Azospirillum oleiclasticum]NYZ11951.1 methyltransferase domain-containing protein [Azospirillum oleiclasticum]NYZ19111.1 methyltransferase domain-containing protein [Azospirillum oleiclasticum]